MARPSFDERNAKCLFFLDAFPKRKNLVTLEIWQQYTNPKKSISTSSSSSSRCNFDFVTSSRAIARSLVAAKLFSLMRRIVGSADVTPPLSSDESPKECTCVNLRGNPTSIIYSGRICSKAMASFHWKII